MFSGPRPRLQEKQHHERKKVEVAKLIENKATTPAKLSSFVKDYDVGLTVSLKQFNQKQAIVALATEHYLKLYTAQIQDCRNNSKKTLQDLSDLLENILNEFPEGDKSLIHCQDSKVYALFCKEIVNALDVKTNLNDDRYTKYNGGKHAGQCVEALLIQHVAKCRIPMNIVSDYDRRSSKPLSAILETFLYRTQRFMQSSNSINHAVFTLAALTNIDINTFTKKVRENSLIVSYKLENACVDPLVAQVVQKMSSSWNEDALIRAVHAIILLSRVDDKFKTYLSDAKAAEILNWIATKLKTLPLNDVKSQHLAQALFQIRNVYTDVFPASLSALIEPHLVTFAENSHGSDFERRVFTTLQSTAKELAREYPTLIDPRHFSANNPICDTLGLESDITYENGAIKTCIQVDGDKYHNYNGTKTPTQRTLLRDHCFKNGHWKLIKFTDSESSAKNAKALLLSEIIIPTFEAKLSSILAFATSPMLDSNGVAQCLESSQVKEASSLTSSLQGLKALLESARAKGIDISPFQIDVEALNSFEAQLNKGLVNARSFTKTLEELKAQFSRLDLNKVKTLADISRNFLKTDKKIMELSTNIKKNEGLVHQIKMKLESHLSERQDLQSQLKEIEEKLAPATSEINKYSNEISELKEMESKLNASISRASGKSTATLYQGLSRAQIKERRAEIDSAMMPLNANHTSLMGSKQKVIRTLGELEQSITQLEKNQSELDAKTKAFYSQLDNEAKLKQSYEMALKNAVEYTNLADKIASLPNEKAVMEKLSKLLLDVPSKIALIQSIEKTINEKLATQSVAQPQTMSADIPAFHPRKPLHYLPGQGYNSVGPVHVPTYQPPAHYYPPMGYVSERGLFCPNNALPVAQPVYSPAFNGTREKKILEIKNPNSNNNNVQIVKPEKK